MLDPAVASPRPRHFAELDALRGLAALVVVTFHLISLLPSPRALALNPLYRGHEAVILFFLLSGFVLALRFFQPGPVSYLGFLVRRTFRIYVPYIAAVTVAALFCLVFAGQAVQGVVGWPQTVWQTPPTWTMVAQHVALIGFFDHRPLNPVIWSLVHEMRLSIVFPLIILLCRFLPIPLLLVGSLGITGLVIGAGLPSLGVTAHYGGLFVVGALLARHHEALTAFLQARSAAFRLALGLGALLMFLYSNVALEKLHVVGLWNDWAIALGGVGVMVTALSSRRAARWLQAAPLLILGRMSYSLYLFHPVVILGLLHALGDRLPLPVVLLAALPLSLAVAALAHHTLERPSIAWGHAITSRLTAPRPVAGPAAEV